MISSLINLDLLVTLIIPEIHRFTVAMGHEMPADGLMMMFIRGMTVDYGDQKLLFRDGRMRLELGDEAKAVRERQQAVKREQKAASILTRVTKMKKENRRT